MTETGIWRSRAEAAEAEVERLRDALEKIAACDEVEAMLDPIWALRRARAALKPA